METNKIYQGDCLELMKQLEDKSVDLILCDLPYGVMDSGWDKGIDLIIYGKKIKKGNGRFGKYIGNRPSHQDEIVREFTNYPVDVLECQEDIGTTKLHTSQKPLELCEFLIKTYSSEGDLVLDNCIGSGTTAVACTNTKRNFIGIELSPEYCKIANERIQKELSQSKLNSEGKFFSSQP